MNVKTSEGLFLTISCMLFIFIIYYYIVSYIPVLYLRVRITYVHSVFRYLVCCRRKCHLPSVTIPSGTERAIRRWESNFLRNFKEIWRASRRERYLPWYILNNVFLKSTVCFQYYLFNAWNAQFTSATLSIMSKCLTFWIYCPKYNIMNCIARCYADGYWFERRDLGFILSAPQISHWCYRDNDWYIYI